MKVTKVTSLVILWFPGTSLSASPAQFLPLTFLHYKRIYYRTPWAGIGAESYLQVTQAPDFTVGIKTMSDWEAHFHWLTEDLPHAWSITPDENLIPAETGQRLSAEWRQYTSQCKLKFVCPTCDHKWTSIEGKVIFHFRLLRNDVHGEVRVRTFKQACKPCSSSSNVVMIEPSWYEDEKEVVLSRLKKRIKKIYYDAPVPRTAIDNGRRAQMGAPHQEGLCEACRLGICADK
uniref:receptor-transporting protein 3-like n=1 Tax=Myxine glutinosa TaxID=7769 RepID=UPI00358E654B